MSSTVGLSLKAICLTDDDIDNKLNYCREVLIGYGELPNAVDLRIKCCKRLLRHIKSIHTSKYLSKKDINKYLIIYENYLKRKPSRVFLRNTCEMMTSILFSNTTLPNELKCLLKVPLPIDSPIYKHLQYLKAAKQLSDKTLARKKHYFRQFQQYINSYEIDLDQINQLTLASFYKAIHATNPIIYNFNHDLHLFFKWLYNQNILKKDISIFINPTKYKRYSIPDPLSAADLSKLWKFTELDSSFVGLRTRAVLGILISTSLRIGDVASLKTSNIEFTKNKAIISIKTHKTKQLITVELHTAAANALFRYMKLSRPKVDSPYIFLTIDGEEASGNTLSRNIRKCIDRCNLRSNQGTNQAHRIRASMATLAANNNTPDYIISSILGHQSSASLSHYVSFNIKALSKCCLEIEPVKGGLYFELFAVIKDNNNG